MAFDTLRTNKMRSALTVLGVVIGITSIVGMTALIRGFDQSLRDLIAALGPNTIFVQRFGISSFAGGAEFKELMQAARTSRSPTPARSRARRRRSQMVDIELGGGGPGTAFQRVFYRNQKTKPMIVFGTAEHFAEGTRIPIVQRPLLQRHRGPVSQERRRARQHRLPAAVQPNGIDPIGKMVRVGSERFEVVGVFDKRPAAGGFNLSQDDFVVIPCTAYQRIYGLQGRHASAGSAGSFLPIQIALVPRDGVTPADAHGRRRSG